MNIAEDPEVVNFTKFGLHRSLYRGYPSYRYRLLVKCNSCDTDNSNKNIAEYKIYFGMEYFAKERPTKFILYSPSSYEKKIHDLIVTNDHPVDRFLAYRELIDVVVPYSHRQIREIDTDLDKISQALKCYGDDIKENIENKANQTPFRGILDILKPDLQYKPINPGNIDRNLENSSKGIIKLRDLEHGETILTNANTGYSEVFGPAMENHRDILFNRISYLQVRHEYLLGRYDSFSSDDEFRIQMIQARDALGIAIFTFILTIFFSISKDFNDRTKSIVPNKELLLLIFSIIILILLFTDIIAAIMTMLLFGVVISPFIFNWYFAKSTESQKRVNIYKEITLIKRLKIEQDKKLKFINSKLLAIRDYLEDLLRNKNN